MVTDVFERLSLQARAAIERASIEASRVLSPRVEPVHLVLGLLDDKASLAARALLSCGLTLEGRRRVLLHGNQDTSFRSVPFSPATRAILQRSLQIALRLRSNYIGAEHLLLAALDSDPSITDLLRLTGTHPAVVRKRLAELQGTLGFHPS